MKLTTKNNIIYKIGQNSNENWKLVESCETFTWLHLNSFPSGHVIIETDEPSKEELIFAAELCKNNTKYRNLRNLKICYTNCGNLIKGNNEGSVLYKSNRRVKYIVI
jgi:predicted ribosome quality control (RQC) complex YloA/Tae2 family protein